MEGGGKREITWGTTNRARLCFWRGQSAGVIVRLKK